MTSEHADWTTPFDRLEAAIRGRKIESDADMKLVAAVSIAVVMGREATQRAEELSADVSALRSQVRELRAAGLRPMPPVVSIHRYGDAVVLDPNGAKIAATVTGVLLEGADFRDVRYRLVWWNDRQMVVTYLESMLVEAADDEAPRAAVVYGGMGAGR
jgi:hypothetical protein